MKKVKKLPPTFVGMLLLTTILIGCADVTPIEACALDKPYGFLGGLWHGFVAPLSFFGSLFFDSIAMYAVNNNGGRYDFGFILGSGTLIRFLKAIFS